MIKVDLIGKRQGKLKIIEKTNNKDSNGSYIWLCICDCGKEKFINTHTLNTHKVMSCGCLKRESLQKRLRKGTNNISSTYFTRIKRRASKKNIYFNVTLEYLQNLLEQQKFKCALTGEILIMDINNTFNITKKHDLNTASLDRIDSLKGYIEGNVQWVHKNINIMKWDLTQDEFISYCNKVTLTNSVASEELLKGLLP